MMSFVQITENNRSQYQPGLIALEKLAEYPLGNDLFQIDHGENYFSFFNRLGKVRYYSWIENRQIAAVFAAVLRKPRECEGVTPSPAWYLCDLKVHPEFRGKRIPLKMGAKAFLPIYTECQRIYAISMNSAEVSPHGNDNRVARLLERFRFLSFRVASQLSIWSLDQRSVLMARPILEKYRGPISFLTLSGVKDIVLKSTGLPMNLLHVQHGPFAEAGLKDPVCGGIHMFCAPTGDPIIEELGHLGFHPTSSAKVLSHRVDPGYWKWILTSDI